MAAAVLCGGGAGAAAPPSAAPMATSPVQPIDDLYTALQAAMRAGRATPFPARFDTLAPVIERVFDLDTVLRVSVGLRWSSFNDAIRHRLSEAFRRFTIASYVANFDKYDGERFVVFPATRAVGADRVVQTEIIAGNGGKGRLDYPMRRFDTAWRAVDVLIDGSISRVAVQRSDFRTVLANGDAETLIEQLHRKVADLSNGSMAA